jgi:hypothetical protein
MCTANAEEAATATTAGAEHSVVERGAPDLNTTQRTAKISDLPQHRPRGAAHWIEQSETPTALAPPIVRANGRARIVTLDRPWPPPRTELVR